MLYSLIYYVNEQLSADIFDSKMLCKTLKWSVYFFVKIHVSYKHYIVYITGKD